MQIEYAHVKRNLRMVSIFMLRTSPAKPPCEGGAKRALQLALARELRIVHNHLMRTHKQIIKAAGGPDALHDRLGFVGKIYTIRSWAARDSIPSDQWLALAQEGIATLDELATAAAEPRAAADPGKAQ